MNVIPTRISMTALSATDEVTTNGIVRDASFVSSDKCTLQS